MLLLVDACRPFLKFLVRAQSGGNLQIGYRLGSPGMFYTVLAVVEESGILQEIAFSVVKSFVVQAYGIFGNVA